MHHINLEKLHKISLNQSELEQKKRIYEELKAKFEAVNQLKQNSENEKKEQDRRKQELLQQTQSSREAVQKLNQRKEEVLSALKNQKEQAEQGKIEVAGLIEKVRNLESTSKDGSKERLQNMRR